MEKIRRLLLFLWTIALLSFRPSIFGEKYNQLVFVFFFLLTGALVFIDLKKKTILDKRRILSFALILICVIYLLIQGLMLSDAVGTVINSCVFLLLTVPCILWVLNRYQESILTLFINIHFWLAISAMITFGIYILVGFSADRLPVVASLYDLVEYAELDENSILSGHVLFFPFTVVWSAAGFMGIDVPRFVGIYREPGMAQIFFCTAFILTFFISVERQSLKKIVLLCGTVLTFSTAGLFDLLIVVLLYGILNASIKRYVIRIIRNPILVVIVIVAFVVIMSESIVMLRERVDQVSGQSRLESFSKGIERLSDNLLFGEGYYNSFQKDENGVVVSSNFIGMMGVSYQLGLVGLFLYSLTWGYSLIFLSNRITICIYIPCLMTLLFSQPSYNDIFTWFILLLNVRNLHPLNR
jgi:hypothetical protein